MSLGLLMAEVLLGFTVSVEPSITAAQYKNLIIAQRGRVKALRGTYVSETKADTAAEKAGLMRGQSSRSTVHFAWLGNKRYRAETSNWISQGLRPFSTESTNVYTGSEFRSRQNKSFRIQAGKSAYSELNAWLSGLKWPLTTAEMEQATSNPTDSLFLPYFLDAADWRTRAQLESTNGVSCVVLEQASGSRRLWLDPQRGYCLVHFEQQHPAPGFKEWINDYTDFQEIGPGFFLPCKAIGRNIYEDASGNVTGVLTTTIAVSNLTANDVPESLFVLEPQTDDSVVDSIHKVLYTYAPRDETTLDVTSDRAIVGGGVSERNTVSFDIICFNLAFIGGVGAIYGAKQIRTRWWLKRPA
jgi:hypothetical protein